jgi:hypothetical protein
METLDKYKWTVLYTDHQQNFIHYNHLVSHNPNANIFKVDISNNYKRDFIWRNSDKLVREWLRNNRSKINTENIAILDWDVLVTQQLPLLDNTGLKAANVITLTNKPRWWWFKDRHKLGKYKQFAIGVAPLGVLFMSNNCIDILLDSEFDYLYNKDIFSELRTPTILNSRGISITKYHLPYVHWKKTTLKSNPGIYHPIKYNVL